MQSLKETVLNCLSELKVKELVRPTERKAKASCPIAIWLPPEYKSKYDELQQTTDRQFGKLMQEVIKKAIDSAK